MKRILIVVLCAVLAVALVGCASTPKAEPSPSVSATPEATVTPTATPEPTAEPTESASAEETSAVDTDSRTPEAVSVRFHAMVVQLATQLNWKSFNVADIEGPVQSESDPREYSSKIAEADIYYLTDENGDVNHAVIVNTNGDDTYIGKVQACAMAYALEPEQDVMKIVNKIDDLVKNEGVESFGNSVVVSSGGEQGTHTVYLVYRMWLDDDMTTVTDEDKEYFDNKWREIIKTYE